MHFLIRRSVFRVENFCLEIDCHAQKCGRHDDGIIVATQTLLLAFLLMHKALQPAVTATPPPLSPPSSLPPED